MEDDDIAFGIMPWCECTDCGGTFNTTIGQQLFTIKEALHQSIVKTLEFPSVLAAESVSVEGPVTVNNVNQHVMARSEIIHRGEVEKSVFRESSLKKHATLREDVICPRKCRDSFSNSESFALVNGGDEDGDEEGDQEDTEFLEEEEEEEDEQEEEENEEEDDGYDDEEDEKADDEYSNYSINCRMPGFRPCRDPPRDNTGNNSAGSLQQYCRDIRRDAETENAEDDEELEEEQVEDKRVEENVIVKEMTADDKAFNDLHQECLYLSKDELKAICKKYKLYDKKARVKRFKSWTGDSECSTEKEKKEAASEKGKGYVCKDDEEDDIDVDDEEDDDDDNKEENVRQDDQHKVQTSNDVCNDENEDYEEEEGETYFGLERPFKAAPVTMDTTEHKSERPLEIVRDYTRYDTRENSEKSKTDMNMACEDKSSNENKHFKSQNDKKSASLLNIKATDSFEVLYYDEALKNGSKTKKEPVKIAEEIKKDSHTEEEAYFGSQVVNVNIPEDSSLSDVYYASNSNNNNNNMFDVDEENGDHYENDEVIKNMEANGGSDIANSIGNCDYTPCCSGQKCGNECQTYDNRSLANGGYAYTECNEADDTSNSDTDGGNEYAGPCAASTTAAEGDLNIHADNQEKYMAYGHSGDDVSDDDYFDSASLLPYEQARTGEIWETILKKDNSTERISRIESGSSSNAYEDECFQPFTTFGLAGSSREPFSSKIATLTSSHFEHCKRVFESMKQRAFGDDYEDYFESCSPGTNQELQDSVKSNSDDISTLEIQSSSLIQEEDSYSITDKTPLPKQGSFLKSLLGIITRSGTKSNRKITQENPMTETVPEAEEITPENNAVDEKKYFNFGRYKIKSKEKALFSDDYIIIKKMKHRPDFKFDKPRFPVAKVPVEIEQEDINTVEMVDDVAEVQVTPESKVIEQNDLEIRNSSYIFNSGKLTNKNRDDDNVDVGDDDDVDVDDDVVGDDDVEVVEILADVSFQGSGDTKASDDCKETLATGTCGFFSFSSYQAKKLADEMDRACIILRGNLHNRSHQQKQHETVHGQTNEEMKDHIREERDRNNLEESPAEVFGNSKVALVNSCEIPARIRNLVQAQDVKLTCSLTENREQTECSTGGSRAPIEERREQIESLSEGSRASTEERREETECSSGGSRVVGENNEDSCLTAMSIDEQVEHTETFEDMPDLTTMNPCSDVIKLDTSVYDLLPLAAANGTGDRQHKNQLNPFYKVHKRNNSRRHYENSNFRLISNSTDYPPFSRNRNEKRSRSNTSERSMSSEKRSVFNYGQRNNNKTTSNRTFAEASKPNLKDSQPVDSRVKNNKDYACRCQDCSTHAETDQDYQREVSLDQIRSSKKNDYIDTEKGIRGRTISSKNRPSNEQLNGCERQQNVVEQSRISGSSARASVIDMPRSGKENIQFNTEFRDYDIPLKTNKLKSTHKHRRFLQSNIATNMRTGEICNKNRSVHMQVEVYDNENHNVNCGCDEDAANCKLENETSITFTEGHQLIPTICDVVDLSVGTSQAIAVPEDTASKIVMESLLIGDSLEADIISNLVSYENPSLKLNPTYHIEHSTQELITNTEMMAPNVLHDFHNACCLTVVSNGDTRSRSRDKELLKSPEDTYSTKNFSNNEMCGKDRIEYSLSIDNDVNGCIIKNYLDKNQKSIQQQRYADSPGMFQDNSEGQWTSKLPVLDESIISHSKIGNEIGHIDNDKRYRWKFAENDDLQNVNYEKNDTLNQNKYAKYNLQDDSSSLFFGDNQIINCANVNSMVQEHDQYVNNNVNDVQIFFGGPYPGSNSYAYSTSEEEMAGANYVDGFSEMKSKFRSCVNSLYTTVTSCEPAAAVSVQNDVVANRLSSPARSIWTPSRGHTDNTFARIMSHYSGNNVLYSNGVNIAKSWGNSESKAADGVDNSSLSSSLYTPEWKVGASSRTADEGATCRNESDKDMVFWSNTMSSPVRAYQRTNINDMAVTKEHEGIKHTDLWSNRKYSPENRREETNKTDNLGNALYSPGGRDGKEWKLSTTFENTEEQVIDKDFWTSTICSPVGNHRISWRMAESIDNRTEEIKDDFWSNTVHSPAGMEGITNNIVGTLESRATDILEGEDCWSTTLYPSLSAERITWRNFNKITDKAVEDVKEIQENKTDGQGAILLPTVIKEKFARATADISVKKVEEDVKEIDNRSTKLYSSVSKDVRIVKTTDNGVTKGIDEQQDKDGLNNKCGKTDGTHVRTNAGGETKSEVFGSYMTSQSPSLVTGNVSTNVDRNHLFVQEKQRKIAARWKENMAGDTVTSILHITKLADLKAMQREYLKEINNSTTRGEESSIDISATGKNTSEDKPRHPYRPRENDNVIERSSRDMGNKMRPTSPITSIAGRQGHGKVPEAERSVEQVKKFTVGESGKQVTSTSLHSGNIATWGRHRQLIVPALNSSPQKVEMQHKSRTEGTTRIERAIKDVGNKFKEPYSPKANSKSEVTGRHGYISGNTWDRKLEQTHITKEGNGNTEMISVEGVNRIQETKSIRVSSTSESSGRQGYVILSTPHTFDRRLEQASKTKESHSKTDKKVAERGNTTKMSTSPRSKEKLDHKDRQRYMNASSKGKNMSVISNLAKDGHTRKETTNEAKVGVTSYRVSNKNETSPKQGYLIDYNIERSKSDQNLQKSFTAKDDNSRKDKIRTERVHNGKEITSPNRLESRNEINFRQAGYADKTGHGKNAQYYKNREGNTKKGKMEVGKQIREHVSPKVDRRFEPVGRYLTSTSTEIYVADEMNNMAQDNSVREDQIMKDTENKDLHSPNRMIIKNEVIGRRDYGVNSANVRTTNKSKTVKDSHKNHTDYDRIHQVRDSSSYRTININEVGNREAANTDLHSKQILAGKSSIRKDYSPSETSNRIKEIPRVINKNESVGRQYYMTASAIGKNYEKPPMKESNSRRENIVDDRVKHVKETAGSNAKNEEINREVSSSIHKYVHKADDQYKGHDNRKEKILEEPVKMGTEWTLRSPRGNIPKGHMHEKEIDSRRSSPNSDSKRQPGFRKPDFTRSQGYDSVHNPSPVADVASTDGSTVYVHHSNIESGNIQSQDFHINDKRIDQGYMTHNGMFRPVQSDYTISEWKEHLQSDVGIVDTKHVNRKQLNNEKSMNREESPRMKSQMNEHSDDALSVRHHYLQHKTGTDVQQNQSPSTTYRGQIQHNELLASQEKKDIEKRSLRISADEQRRQSPRVNKVDVVESIINDDKQAGTMNSNTHKVTKFDTKVAVDNDHSNRSYQTSPPAIQNDMARSDHLKNIKDISAGKPHKQKPYRMFKIDYEEKFGEKARNKTRETTQKQKQDELVLKKNDSAEYLKAHVSKPTTDLLAGSAGKDKWNKTISEKYHYKQRLQKSETRVTDELKRKVENSRSEVNSHHENLDRTNLMPPEDNKKTHFTTSQRDEKKKWKTEIHRKILKPENERVSPLAFVEERWKDNDIPRKGAQYYKGDVGHGEGRVKSRGENVLSKPNNIETIGDSVHKHSRDINQSIKMDAKSNVTITHDNASKKQFTNQDSESKNSNFAFDMKRRESLMKKSRPDSNQPDRYNSTFIDNSVVDTVARAWMDDVGKADTPFLKDAKLFSPAVLIQQTSGSASASTIYLNSPIAMINNQGLPIQNSAKKIPGEYLEVFPRPTFLRPRTLQEVDDGDSFSEYSGKVSKRGLGKYLNTNEQHNDDTMSQYDQVGDKLLVLKQEEMRDLITDKAKRGKATALERRTPDIESSSSRSYYNYADINKAVEIKKQLTKDDSFINRRQNYHEIKDGSVSRPVEKQINRYNRQVFTSDKFQLGNEQQKRQQNALVIPEERFQSKIKHDGFNQSQPRERKGIDSKNTKLHVDHFKDMKRSSKNSKTSKVTELSQSQKVVHDNSKEDKTAAERQASKVHMFSYKVSSRGSRSEIVKSDAKSLQNVVKHDIEDSRSKKTAQASTLAETVSENHKDICESKDENARREPAQEAPVQLGLFARILNSLTRSSNTVTTTQLVETSTAEPKQEDTRKPEFGECSRELNKSDTGSASKGKGATGTKNKTLRSRSPLVPVRESKGLRPEYKQNRNCNAACEDTRWTKTEPVRSLDSMALKSAEYKHKFAGRTDNAMSNAPETIPST